MQEMKKQMCCVVQCMRVKRREKKKRIEEEDPASKHEVQAGKKREPSPFEERTTNVPPFTGNAESS
jgi:hypothetical protein